MASQIYSIGEIYIEGSKLLEEAQMSISRKTNSQAVLTVAKGYAGESPGAAMTEVDVTNAVPAAAFEFDAGEKMYALSVVEFTFFAAGEALTFKGTIIEDSFSHAVNSEAKVNFKARGQFARWK